MIDLLELKNISKFYQNEGNVQLGLRRASISFNKGEFVAITGESGSGKSTLLNVISGLDKYDEGDMFLNGESTSYFSIEDLEKYRKDYIGFVFQDYNIIDSYTVYENVVAALVLQNYPKDKRKARALELIDRVGLSKQRNQKTVKLSGGQKQRVVIARALAKDAPIIVADEPTGNLDAKSGEMIMALLKEVSKDKLVIVVTHNYEQVKPYATRKVHLFDGEIIEDKVLIPAEPSDILPAGNKPLNVVGHLYFSFINILRNPKKSIILFLSFITLISATLIVVASQKSSLTTPYMGHPFINNPFDERIVIKKSDSSNFSNAEVESFYSSNYVNGVIHRDHILDYSFRVVIDNDPHNYEYKPLLPTSAKVELSSGRLPTSDKEIALPTWHENNNPLSAELIAGYETQTKYNLSVVGYVKGSKPVVHDSFLNQTTLKTPVDSDLFSETKEYNNRVIRLKHSSSVHFIYPKDEDIRSDVSLGEVIQISQAYIDDNPIPISNGEEVSITYNNVAYTFSVEIINDTVNSYVVVPFSNEELKGIEISQISIVLKDKVDAKNYINSLTNTYTAIHPASYKASGLSVFSVAEFMLTTIVVLFSVIILNIIVKNIYKAKNKDIAIMRSIGASKKDIRKIYIIETILTVIFSSLLALGVVYYIGKYAFKTHILKILGVGNSLFYIVLFLLIGLYIINKFLNRLFGRTVIQTLRGGNND